MVQERRKQPALERQSYRLQADKLPWVKTKTHEILELCNFLLEAEVSGGETNPAWSISVVVYTPGDQQQLLLASSACQVVICLQQCWDLTQEDTSRSSLTQDTGDTSYTNPENKILLFESWVPLTDLWLPGKWKQLPTHYAGLLTANIWKQVSNGNVIRMTDHEDCHSPVAGFG